MQINKKGAALATTGVALAAIVLGGTTTALWSDLTDISGATITAGNLDVTDATTMKWQDVSKVGNLNENPDIADITAFRTVPGDYLEGTSTFDVVLEGDNIAATVDLVRASDTGDTAIFNSTNGFVVTYDVYDNNVLKAENVAGNAASNFKFDNAGQGSAPVIHNMKVVTKVHFNNDTADQGQTNTKAVAVLGDTAVKVAQVRAAAPVIP